MAYGKPEMHHGYRIFSLCGRNERYAESLGLLPWPDPERVEYLELKGDFLEQSFSEQVSLVRNTILRDFMTGNAVLVGRSFGAWILLNALLRIPSFPGAFIGISSVLGEGGSGAVGFIAPRYRTFWKEVEDIDHSPARRFGLIHAMNDPQCPFSLAARLSSKWQTPLIGFDEGGHRLAAPAQMNAIWMAILQILDGGATDESDISENQAK